MRVLICIPCLLTGGTEIQALSLIGALETAGHETAVVCYFEYDNEMVEKFQNVGAKVFLLSSPILNHNSLVNSYDDVKSTDINYERPRGIKSTFKFLFKGLKKTIKDFNPDIAHVQYMAPGALTVVILKLLGIKKIFATSHTSGDIYSSKGLKAIRLLNKTVIDAFQCITLKAEESYFGTSSIFDGKKQRHFTIYNSLPQHISIRNRNTTKNFADNKPLTIGVVSRLAHIKGMDLVIPAFIQALEKYNLKNVRLLIVGDGKLKSDMEKQALDSNYSNLIEFAGKQSSTQLQDYYDKIDILLMPSRSEGFGLTALEGMARGCVPVVSETGGLPELVTEDVGMLHKPIDVDDLADKIGLLVNDRNRLKEMSDKAIKRAGLFSKENYYDLIRRWYESENIERIKQPLKIF